MDSGDKKTASKQRKPRGGYTQVFNAFLDSEKLTQYEKLVFIAIKSFADNKTKQAYPSLATISRVSGTSLSQVRRSIARMKEMGILKVEQRKSERDNGCMSNLYTLYDSPDMWDDDFSTEEEDLKAVVREIPDDILEQEYLRRHPETKKELESVPTKAQNQAVQKNQYARNNNISNSHNCQERYSLDQVKELFGYETIKLYLPYSKELDDVMNILYDVLNTTKPTIRVGKEEKPTMIVVGRLMKLTSDHIIFAIDQYTKQTNKINNPESYILTILYKAVSQMDLSISNSIEHNMYGQQDDDN